jgi:hypothetical protein
MWVHASSAFGSEMVPRVFTQRRPNPPAGLELVWTGSWTHAALYAVLEG